MDTVEGVVLIVAVLAVFGAIFFVARNETIKRKLLCPRTGALAEVEILRRYEEPNRAIKVRSCTLFPEPRKVTCEQDCLKIVS
jgi:hypothetical protein